MMLKTRSVKAMRSRPSESTDRLIVLTKKGLFSLANSQKTHIFLVIEIKLGK